MGEEEGGWGREERRDGERRRDGEGMCYQERSWKNRNQTLECSPQYSGKKK